MYRPAMRHAHTLRTRTAQWLWHMAHPLWPLNWPRERERAARSMIAPSASYLDSACFSSDTGNAWLALDSACWCLESWSLGSENLDSLLWSESLKSAALLLAATPPFSTSASSSLISLASTLLYSRACKNPRVNGHQGKKIIIQ